jgi:hypothetical protein
VWDPQILRKRVSFDLKWHLQLAGTEQAINLQATYLEVVTYVAQEFRSQISHHHIIVVGVVVIIIIINIIIIIIIRDGIAQSV